MKFRKFILNLLLTVLVIALTVAVLEGFASIFIFLREVVSNPAPLVAERKHTEYDELLGWINIPDLYIKDMYGPGVYLETNSQSFRADEDYGLDKNQLNTGLILSVGGIPYFNLDMDKFGSKNLLYARPGINKCCLRR